MKFNFSPFPPRTLNGFTDNSILKRIMVWGLFMNVLLFTFVPPYYIPAIGPAICLSMAYFQASSKYR